MALGLTEPLTEMSTRTISLRVKAAGALGWQPYNLHVPTVLKSGSLNLLEPSGPVQAWKGIVLHFTDGHEVNFTLRKHSITRKETVANESSLEQILPYKIQ